MFMEETWLHVSMFSIYIYFVREEAQSEPCGHATYELTLEGKFIQKEGVRKATKGIIWFLMQLSCQSR